MHWKVRCWETNCYFGTTQKMAQSDESLVCRSVQSLTKEAIVLHLQIAQQIFLRIKVESEALSNITLPK